MREETRLGDRGKRRVWGNLGWILGEKISLFFGGEKWGPFSCAKEEDPYDRVRKKKVPRVAKKGGRTFKEKGVEKTRFVHAFEGLGVFFPRGSQQTGKKRDCVRINVDQPSRSRFKYEGSIPVVKGWKMAHPGGGRKKKVGGAKAVNEGKERSTIRIRTDLTKEKKDRFAKAHEGQNVGREGEKKGTKGGSHLLGRGG